MKNKLTRSITEIAMLAALICICSFITIPFFTVPITMQSFGVFCALFMLGGCRGTVAVAVYLALGTVGLPVFSGFTGGVGRLFDTTGGFLFGFLAAALVYLLLTTLLPRTEASSIIAAIAAHAAIYLLGGLWLALFFTDGSAAAALTAIVPCLVPDAIKLTLAYLFSAKIKKHLKT